LRLLAFVFLHRLVVVGSLLIRLVVFQQHVVIGRVANDFGRGVRGPLAIAELPVYEVLQQLPPRAGLVWRV